MGLQKYVSYVRAVLSGLPVPHLFWIEIFLAALLCEIVILCSSVRKRSQDKQPCKTAFCKMVTFIVNSLLKER